ncbi:hypothetical protein EDB82DRAFT_473066 [Fusarium venenatum]|uniref:uncharacterized protein n=1 Tax=Fusarium venenatum TaxID=56646 RepID=UPI001DC7A037|nr:hypothetical protein EDB82DRAFT_473066 [Fusarium venenatum]
MEATSSHLGPSHPVDFIINFVLQTSTGTDIPLYSKTLEVEKKDPDKYPEIKRYEGDRSDVFDSEKEDYWLFYVHFHYAELEIAIGGDEPIYFVTQDPYKKVGIKDFEHAPAKNKGQSPWPKRYMWGAEGTTYVRISRKMFLGDHHPAWFDYVSGVILKDEVTNKGWELLLEVFGSTVQILKGVLSVSVADVVQVAISLGDAFNEEKMHQEANFKGFLTVIGDEIDLGNKARKDGKKKKAEEPNVTNILILVQHIEAGMYSRRDLGSRPREIE